MTEFQDSCLRKVKAVLVKTPSLSKIEFEEKHVLASDFLHEVVNLLRRVIGFPEIPYQMKELPKKSLIARFNLDGHNFAIYIYEEDAEIHRDDAWFVCERPDYESEAQLIQDLVNRLSRAISNEDFQSDLE